MNRYYLELTVHLPGLDADQAEAAFEPLADAVYELVDVADADLGARLAESEFDFTMFVDAEDEVAALTAGLAAVRTAIHAVGGATPSWEGHFETIQQLVRREPTLA